MMGQHERAALLDGTVLTRKAHEIREHIVKARTQTTFRLHKARGGASADAGVGDGKEGTGAQEVA